MSVESITTVLGRHLTLLPYMKVASTRFEQVGLVIASRPTSHGDVTIYGVFYVDRDNVAKNDVGRKVPVDEVVQDYVAHDRSTDAVTHYSGGTGPPTKDRLHIRNFCQRFGRFADGQWGQYGCDGANKCVPLHRYRNASDPRLPVEPHLRAAIAATIESVRHTPGPSAPAGSTAGP